MAQERPEAFNFWGPKTLVGPELKPGDAAPAFSLIDGKGETVGSEAFAGKPALISVVPSLDTGVCSIQTRRFDKEIEQFVGQISLITVSADLPFAQTRWVNAEGVEHVTVLSDHRDMSFGDAYGTHVKEVRLDSRAVFVVDGQGVIRYAEYVPVAGSEPNYEAALEAVKSVVA
ncbi:thiol peroxidase [Chloroflexia bacterium SDU3-3]|nr:thiol peroxidase [Chloroflexia bacterium SDU3-3]